MTTKLDSRLKPAQHTHSHEEEVKDMAFLESRRARAERAGDEAPEINEIDRVVILEAMRQRRRMRQQQLRIHNELFGLRANR